jgi:hypothetical protein
VPMLTWGLVRSNFARAMNFLFGDYAFPLLFAMIASATLRGTSS